MKDSGLGSDPLRRADDAASRASHGTEVAVSTAAGVMAGWSGGGLRGALGIIQVHGFVPMIVAVDTMSKAAHVDLVGYETAGDGLLAVMIQGEVGAVRHAVDAGAEAARRLGDVVSISVLARPDGSLADVLPMDEAGLQRSRSERIW